MYFKFKRTAPVQYGQAPQKWGCPTHPRHSKAHVHATESWFCDIHLGSPSTQKSSHSPYPEHIWVQSKMFIFAVIFLIRMWLSFSGNTTFKVLDTFSVYFDKCCCNTNRFSAETCLTFLGLSWWLETHDKAFNAYTHHACRKAGASTVASLANFKRTQRTYKIPLWEWGSPKSEPWAPWALGQGGLQLGPSWGFLVPPSKCQNLHVPKLQLRKNQPAWSNEGFPALSSEKGFRMLEDSQKAKILHFLLLDLALSP